MAGCPDGGPYFTASGSWDAYKRWSLMVPCTGCGKRKIDNPTRYGLQPNPDHPDSWVTEELCTNCWEGVNNGRTRS